MANSTSSRPGEFELIAELFAPLSRALPGAFGLSDDVAVLAPLEGHEVVLKTDAIVEGVHFRASDPPETIAKKALRVNVSDFAAKGANPYAYLLALALPDWPDAAWLKRFAGGLAADQTEFGVTLAGGDTVRTPGPLTVTITMIGHVPSGTLVRRNGAKPGDRVLVTGTVGDAGGGLELLEAGRAVDHDWQAELISRYRVPEPRPAFGRKLRGLASASLDVSDGLMADLAHMADVSQVRIEIAADRVPLSKALLHLRGDRKSAAPAAVSSGDDYEIVFSLPPGRLEAVQSIAVETATHVTEIGRVMAGEGVVLLDVDGTEIALSQTGYTHF
jgi:thiamine-monophosphate kinase